MNKYFDWDFESRGDIQEKIESIALSVIRNIDMNSAMFSVEERAMKISGALALLDRIVSEIDECAKKEEEDKKAFAESCKAAAEAADNLFVTKTWKIATGVPDDGTHS